MSPRYADIIVDISHEAIDRSFQYRVPDQLLGKLGIGSVVNIPFGNGNRVRTGYVVGFSDQPMFDEARIKEIAGVREGAVPVEASLIALASFIRERYGSTMINALKTVMPVKEQAGSLRNRQVRLLLSGRELTEYLELCRKKNAKAKLRLAEMLSGQNDLPMSYVTGELNISGTTLKAMQKDGSIDILEQTVYREVLKLSRDCEEEAAVPNPEQLAVIDRVMGDLLQGLPGTYLLRGITGSGKTLVYIEMIDRVLAMGRQAIVLIPEIALTWQTVRRFQSRFGTRVTILNSRLSKGERYDQFQRAKAGEVSVVIGPRSALFVPFEKLGLIVVDEEHESAYKSEYPPKYHARDVAIERARMAGASVVLGSATPSVESYYKALKGEYHLLTLKKRARAEAVLPQVSVVDLRRELQAGNRSIFSGLLKQKMEERLQRREQTMLFINRRGFAGFVSCRSCGYVFRCVHCDVSLTEHFGDTPSPKLVCHYCGYAIRKPKLCPSCQSPFIASFGLGTQKVEEQVKRCFPAARVLRMDTDTMKRKDAHERLLSLFADGGADILVGTQMIVKGHDFPNVTLVGVMAADLTLFENDYRSAEHTFDLLTQAAGRAGRGSLKGDVVIQTYAPDHYSITAAARQDYDAFYEAERAYRSLLSYPPFGHVMAVFCEGADQKKLAGLTDELGVRMRQWGKEHSVLVTGPCDATIARVNDRYRRVLYAKHAEYEGLIQIKNKAEDYLNRPDCAGITVSFDMDPMHSY